MGKKKQAGSLGRTIIKDRFGGKAGRNDSSQMHTTDLDDGFEWNRLNLRSVTEENTLEEFLATAEMAGTEFTAEKLNITVVEAEKHSGLLTAEEERRVQQTQTEHRGTLKIPRRPFWDESTSAEDLDLRERDAFLIWRRKLAELQEIEGLILTPFERNLDFWRQLWRVIERSDIVVQIVDARNPQLFRCEDLEKYVKEVGEDKLNIILINKADYLSQKQREFWAAFFDTVGVHVIFWSARLQEERNKEANHELMTEEDEEMDSSEDEEEEDEEEEDEEEEDISQNIPSDNLIPRLQSGQSEDPGVDDNVSAMTADKSSGQSYTCDQTIAKVTGHPEAERIAKTPNEETVCDSIVGSAKLQSGDSSREETSTSLKSVRFCEEPPAGSDIRETVGASPMDQTGDAVCQSVDKARAVCDGDSQRRVQNNPDLLTGDELIHLLKSLHTTPKVQEGITTVGMVGYPNVGKSSTINAILQTKKVPVSATPGRTKHFQTLFVDQSLLLCDCPGLVMPTFVSTKAEMVTSGILPIDQMRDFVPPVSLVCRHLPRRILELMYGIMLPLPREGEDPNRPPTAYEFLASYAYMRGFMTHKGIPDYQRAARLVLKDYVSGKLLYCQSPPEVSVEDFEPTPDPIKHAKEKKPDNEKLSTEKKQAKKPQFSNEVDKSFFGKMEPKMGSRGKYSSLGAASAQVAPGGSVHGSQTSLAEKPWKKHHNRGKKEKQRRITGYLDA